MTYLQLKKLIGILIIVCIGMAFLFVGRSFYMPLIYKAKGKETVSSVTEKISKDVQRRLAKNLQRAGFTNSYPDEIVLAAFKETRSLEVYAKTDKGYTLLKTYPFTAYSGELGPKLQEGDKQIPEGIYRVEYLNPNSSYYLSIKVDYPNAYDISKSNLTSVKEMGGDIFIHGKAATIGCIPIGDKAIEEIFLLTHKADSKVKIIISPRDFRTNPNYPSIAGIDWETELYDIISNELNLIKSDR